MDRIYMNGNTLYIEGTRTRILEFKLAIDEALERDRLVYHKQNKTEPPIIHPGIMPGGTKIVVTVI